MANQERVRSLGASGEYRWRQVLDRSNMPSFSCSEAELAETQEAFLSMWDGKVPLLPPALCSN